MKLGILITTYQKPDGTTPSLLNRALKSIESQTHEDYIIIVVGDNYENNEELNSICQSFNFKGNILVSNLPYAKERDRYPIGSREWWASGGVNARNQGIDICLNEGVDYICHLDHDDYWHPQHLEVINHTIEVTKKTAVVINTCSTYFNSYLPKTKLTNEIIPSNIQPGTLIHSSAFFEINRICRFVLTVFIEPPFDIDCSSI